jgi:hypothetical protein
MRAPNRGLLAQDMALSLSYFPSTGVTCALLLGHSERQMAFIREQIICFGPIANHPALIPTLICTYRRFLLRKLVDEQYSDLYMVEDESQQSLLWYKNARGSIPRARFDPEETSKKALLIIQLITSWERYTKSLIFEIKSIQQFIDKLENSKDYGIVRTPSKMLRERLDFLSHKATIMLNTTQSIKERALALLSAVGIATGSSVFSLTLFEGLQLHSPEEQ